MRKKKNKQKTMYSSQPLIAESFWDLWASRGIELRAVDVAGKHSNMHLTCRPTAGNSWQVQKVTFNSQTARNIRLRDKSAQAALTQSSSCPGCLGDNWEPSCGCLFAHAHQHPQFCFSQYLSGVPSPASPTLPLYEHSPKPQIRTSLF